jgi:hypothetical protein
MGRCIHIHTRVVKLLWFLRQTTTFRNKTTICDNSEQHRREKLVSRHNGKFDNKPRAGEHGNNDYPRVIKIKIKNKKTNRLIRASDVSEHDLLAPVDNIIIIIYYVRGQRNIVAVSRETIILLQRDFFGARAYISSCIRTIIYLLYARTARTLMEHLWYRACIIENMIIFNR